MFETVMIDEFITTWLFPQLYPIPNTTHSLVILSSSPYSFLPFFSSCYSVLCLVIFLIFFQILVRLATSPLVLFLYCFTFADTISLHSSFYIILLLFPQDVIFLICLLLQLPLQLIHFLFIFYPGSFLLLLWQCMILEIYSSIKYWISHFLFQAMHGIHKIFNPISLREA